MTMWHWGSVGSIHAITTHSYVPMWGTIKRRFWSMVYNAINIETIFLFYCTRSSWWQTPWFCWSWTFRYLVDSLIWPLGGEKVAILFRSSIQWNLLGQLQQTIQSNDQYGCNHGYIFNQTRYDFSRSIWFYKKYYERVYCWKTRLLWYGVVWK